MIETMTLKEAVAEMEKLGMHITATTLCDRLELGIYPFGVAYKMPGNKRRSVEIYKVKFDKWASELKVVGDETV